MQGINVISVNVKCFVSKWISQYVLFCLFPGDTICLSPKEQIFLIHRRGNKHFILTEGGGDISNTKGRTNILEDKLKN